MDDRVTLLLEVDSSIRDWNASSDGRNIVHVESFALLEAALETKLCRASIEFAAVILDRSVTAAKYLELLSRLPAGFRGDVVLINHDGTGFLSAVTPNDGRLLYRLSTKETDFYVKLRFGVVRFGEGSEATGRELLPTETCN